MDLVQKFLESFVPLFVAIDAIGIMGIFLGLTEGLNDKVRRRLVTDATLTALGISLIFLAFGKILFQLLGITQHDFRIAGGLVLLILAIMDLLFSQHEKRRSPDPNIAVVPIGIPLIMGPAALTTILVSNDSNGFWITLIALLLNLAITWVVFRYAHKLIAIIGTGGSKAVAKVMALFLAAIAIMMIRVGISGILEI